MRVEQLPKLFRLEGDAIVCGSCRRKWRAPRDGQVSVANFQYLGEHAIGHVRLKRKPPAKTGGFPNAQPVE